MNEQKDVRTRMQEALSKFNIKQVDVAREAGIHHSTLSLWLQGKVKGHHIGIEDTLNQWLENLYSGKNRYTTLNKTTDKRFILTPPALNSKRKSKAIDSEQILIPVYIDLDLQIQGRKYKQVFCWNINDPYYTPEEYAKLIVSENSLLAFYEGKIAEAIRKAINDYYRTGKSPKQQQCIKNILLDIKVGNMCLKDRFEWDVNDSDSSPQDFAYHLCKELNLNGEFMVKIAHQIREQVDFYQKQEFINPSFNLVSEADTKQFILMADMKKSTRHLVQFAGNSTAGELQGSNTLTAHSYIRPDNPYDWEPEIQILDAGEIRKFQTKEERKNRYARRSR